MLIVAHRGGNPNDVDNSSQALIHGINVGSDLLECDLQLSADDEIVIYHDTKYAGVPISQFTTDELRGLIPTLLTLEQIFDVVDRVNPQMRLVLDLKDRNVDRSLASFLNDPQMINRVLVTSTFSFGLWRLKRRFPRLRTGLSRGSTLTRVPTRFRSDVGRIARPIFLSIARVQMGLMGIQTAVLHHDLVSEKGVQFFHGKGMRVYVWTVDDPDRAKQIQSLGADYLTTNDPASIIAALDHGEAGGSTP